MWTQISLYLGIIYLPNKAHSFWRLYPKLNMLWCFCTLVLGDTNSSQPCMTSGVCVCVCVFGYSSFCVLEVLLIHEKFRIQLQAGEDSFACLWSLLSLCSALFSGTQPCSLAVLVSPNSSLSLLNSVRLLGSIWPPRTEILSRQWSRAIVRLTLFVS